MNNTNVESLETIIAVKIEREKHFTHSDSIEIQVQ